MTKQKIRIKSALLFLSARQSIPKQLAEMTCPGMRLVRAAFTGLDS